MHHANTQTDTRTYTGANTHTPPTLSRPNAGSAKAKGAPRKFLPARSSAAGHDGADTATEHGLQGISRPGRSFLFFFIGCRTAVHHLEERSKKNVSN